MLNAIVSKAAMSLSRRCQRSARYAALPLLTVFGLALACHVDQTSGLWTDVLEGPKACMAPATRTPPAGLAHPELGSESVLLNGTPFAVAISPAGVTYVTQSWASSAARADLPSTTFSPSFPVGAFPSQVRMTADGRRAYVGNQNNPIAGTITVLDVATNQVVDSAKVPAGAILTIGLSPDGKRLFALTDYDGVYIFNATSGALMDSIPVDSTGRLLTGVAFHPFSPCMYIAARDEGKVSTVDLRTMHVVVRSTVSGARIQNVAVSRDGSTLFATDIERSKLLVWNLQAGGAAPLEYAIGTGIRRNAFDVAVTPDNAQVYVSTLYDGKIFVLDRGTRALVGAVTTSGSPRYIGFNASGTRAVIPNEYGWVSFIRPDLPDVCGAPSAGTAPAGGSHPALTSSVAVPLTGTPFAVAISPAGVTYVTQLLAGSAARADLPSTSFATPFPVGGLPSQVRMSPDGRTAYVENQDARTITFIDVATNQPVATLNVPGGSILNTGLSPDGRRLYALTDFAGVQIIDLETRTVVDSIPAARTGWLLTGVAFHPFAPCMYLAARDEGTIRTVNLETNRVVRSQTVPGGRIQNLAVSRDGALLFATDIERSKLLVRDLSADGSAFLESAVGTPRARNAFDVAVTPDNKQVFVTTLADGKVFVFDRATRALLASVVTGGNARYVAFDAAGTTAVVANEAGWVNFVR
jgi:YVTN family beta-propeller protein